MLRLFITLLIIAFACPLWAGNLQVNDFREEKIDLFDPASGEYLKTIESKGLAVPLPIEKELNNGTYLVTLNGEKVCLDSASVKTNKVYNFGNLTDCNNSVETHYNAAGRGLGEGCKE